MEKALICFTTDRYKNSTEILTKNLIKMNKVTLEKANKLNDRIENLSKMQRDLRPKFCSGVAFAKIPTGNANFNDKNYSYHLWGTTPDSAEDNAVLMRHAIQSMYDKVCLLLEEAESDLKSLK